MAGSLVGVGRERKGTMFLRSTEMNYSRAVLNSKWHQAREGEPRDYDLSSDPVRDLRRSTYQHLGVASAAAPIESTYMNHFKENPLPVKRSASHDEAENELEKDVRRTKHDFVVIPRHNSAKLPNHYVTTHKSDYRSHGPFSETVTNAGVSRATTATTYADYNDAVKRCLSQFTDTAGHRRSGRNTWQDESGVYANGLLKSACPYYSRTYTLMPGGVRPDVDF